MAKRIELNISHRLDASEALERVKALGEYYKNRHGAEVSWNGDGGHINGKWVGLTADISFRVTGKEVLVDGPDPGFLLRGKVTKYLDGKLKIYLDPSTPLDELPRR